jgi:thiaminase/transcriptional activator TenA
MSAVDALWEAIAPVHQAILGHPFLRGLTDGTLPEDAFSRYVHQDALFLDDYARALALCGARAGATEDVRTFCAHAAEAVAAERALHDELMPRLGIAQAAAEPSPTCLAYTSFLLSTCALGDRGEALGAILPCYWIYWRVGTALAERGSPDPRYAAWIAAYAGDDFSAAARAAIAACDRGLSGLTPAQSAAATRRAVTAARFEWMFWDSAWRGERWGP